MGTVVEFDRHMRASLNSRGLGEKIVGGHGTAGEGLEARGQFPRRPSKAAADAADRRAIRRDTGCNRVVGDPFGGHPVGELHGRQSASSAQCMSSTCASDAVDAKPHVSENPKMVAVPEKPAADKVVSAGLARPQRAVAGSSGLAAGFGQNHAQQDRERQGAL